jgi:hypothetical protein
MRAAIVRSDTRCSTASSAVNDRIANSTSFGFASSGSRNRVREARSASSRCSRAINRACCARNSSVRSIAAAIVSPDSSSATNAANQASSSKPEVSAGIASALSSNSVPA